MPAAKHCVSLALRRAASFHLSRPLRTCEISGHTFPTSLLVRISLALDSEGVFFLRHATPDFLTWGPSAQGTRPPGVCAWISSNKFVLRSLDQNRGCLKRLNMQWTRWKQGSDRLGEAAKRQGEYIIHPNFASRTERQLLEELNFWHMQVIDTFGIDQANDIVKACTNDTKLYDFCWETLLASFRSKSSERRKNGSASRSHWTEADYQPQLAVAMQRYLLFQSSHEANLNMQQRP